MRFPFTSNLTFSLTFVSCVALTSCLFQSSLLAQTVPITFSGTSAQSSDSVVFAFPTTPTTTSVSIDQLGLPNDIDQNNDMFGQELFLSTNTGISSIGIVNVNDMLTSGQSFGVTPTSNPNNIDLASFATAGSPIYAGFAEVTTGNVGYFQISFGDDDSITYSDGFFGQGGESLTVTDPNAVPEPSALAGIGLLAILAATRRRRRP